MRTILTLWLALASFCAFGQTLYKGNGSLNLAPPNQPPSYNLPPAGIQQAGATPNQVLTWNGSAWVPATVPGGGGSATNAIANTNGFGVSTTLSNATLVGVTSGNGAGLTNALPTITRFKTIATGTNNLYYAIAEPSLLVINGIYYLFVTSIADGYDVMWSSPDGFNFQPITNSSPLGVTTITPYAFNGGYLFYSHNACYTNSFGTNVDAAHLKLIATNLFTLTNYWDNSTNIGAYKAELVKVSGVYHAYVEVSSSTNANGFVVDHFTSATGTNGWVADTHNPVIVPYGAYYGICAGPVFVYGTNWYMLAHTVNGGDSGSDLILFQSTDGVSWTNKPVGLFLARSGPSEYEHVEYGQIADPWITDGAITGDGITKIFYSANYFSNGHILQANANMSLSNLFQTLGQGTVAQGARMPQQNLGQTRQYDKMIMTMNTDGDIYAVENVFATNGSLGINTQNPGYSSRGSQLFNGYNTKVAQLVATNDSSADADFYIEGNRYDRIWMETFQGTPGSQITAFGLIGNLWEILNYNETNLALNTTPFSINVVNQTATFAGEVDMNGGALFTDNNSRIDYPANHNNYLGGQTYFRSVDGSTTEDLISGIYGGASYVTGHGGAFGIGTQAPQFAADINGTASISNLLKVVGNISGLNGITITSTNDGFSSFQSAGKTNKYELLITGSGSDGMALAYTGKSNQFFTDSLSNDVVIQELTGGHRIILGSGIGVSTMQISAGGVGITGGATNNSSAGWNGNGLGLTNLNASNLVGTISYSTLPSVVLTNNEAANTKFVGNVGINATPTYPFQVQVGTNLLSFFDNNGVLEVETSGFVPVTDYSFVKSINNASGSGMFFGGGATNNTAAGWNGNGQGLTNLNASQLNSGTVPFPRLTNQTSIPTGTLQLLLTDGTNAAATNSLPVALLPSIVTTNYSMSFTDPNGYGTFTGKSVDGIHYTTGLGDGDTGIIWWDLPGTGGPVHKYLLVVNVTNVNNTLYAVFTNSTYTTNGSQNWGAIGLTGTFLASCTNATTVYGEIKVEFSVSSTTNSGTFQVFYGNSIMPGGGSSGFVYSDSAASPGNGQFKVVVGTSQATNYSNFKTLFYFQ